VAKDKSVVPLAVATNQALASLKDFSLLTNGIYDLQLIDSEGRTNKVPAQFVFEAQKNRLPELKLVTPRGDQRVSPLEEITFNGEVWDDFGIQRYGLTYRIEGGEPHNVALGTNTAANEKRKLSTMLRLEDEKVVPDQLISWYL